MAFMLRDDLAVCIVDDRPVFLDIGRDRYFLLRPRHESIFLDIVRGGDDVDPALRADLFRLLRLSEPFSILGETRMVEEAATRPLEPLETDGAPVHLIVRAAIEQWLSERRVRRISLVEIVREIAVTRGTECRLGSQQRRIIAAHRSAGLLRTTRGKCLSATLALADALARGGCFPRIILGVSLSPFQAHCWLQHDDVVLNDHPDRVRPFTPILVL